MGILNLVDYLPGRIFVGPNGYLNSWNVFAEQSKAPDVDFIRQIITYLKTYANNPRLVSYSYLDGVVIHYKLMGGAHNTGTDFSVQAAVNDFLTP